MNFYKLILFFKIIVNFCVTICTHPQNGQKHINNLEYLDSFSGVDET